ncbi:MAG: hypothetical protein WBR28_22360 [Mycobacterium sp.]
MGNLIFASPLAMATGLKSVLEMCLGIDGWKADADAAIAIAAPLDPISHVAAIMWKYVSSVPIGAVAAGATAFESLLDRSADDDLQKAQAAIDRLAAAPTDAGFVLHDLTQLRLRALVAQAHGDASAHREFMARFHARAAAAGFEPLVAGAVEHLHGTAVE